MTKNEIALWWKLMEAKAEVKFQRACVNLKSNDTYENFQKYFYYAMFWQRVEQWGQS